MKLPFSRQFIEELLEDDALPPFSERQWDALCGDVEMTQEMYNEILDLCCEHTSFAEYYEIRQSFPAFNEIHDKHLAEKYGFVPSGKFGGIIEFEQFDFILEKSFQENGIDINDGRSMELLNEVWQ